MNMDLLKAESKRISELKAVIEHINHNVVQNYKDKVFKIEGIIEQCGANHRYLSKQNRLCIVKNLSWSSWFNFFDATLLLQNSKTGMFSIDIHYYNSLETLKLREIKDYKDEN